MKFFDLFVLSNSFMSLVVGQNLCDEFYGLNCPEESSWSVGTCLKQLDQESINKECLDFIQLHDTCKVKKNRNSFVCFSCCLICSQSINKLMHRMILIHIALVKNIQVKISSS